ncbi:uncharacterized protein AAES06_007233 [Glossophaga mutica]
MAHGQKNPTGPYHQGHIVIKRTLISRAGKPAPGLKEALRKGTGTQVSRRAPGLGHRGGKFAEILTRSGPMMTYQDFTCQDFKEQNRQAFKAEDVTQKEHDSLTKYIMTGCIPAMANRGSNSPYKAATLFVNYGWKHQGQMYRYAWLLPPFSVPPTMYKRSSFSTSSPTQVYSKI